MAGSGHFKKSTLVIISPTLLSLCCCCCCIVVLRLRLTSKVMSGRSVNLTTLFLSRLRPSVIFIAGRPKAALLFWFFGDFRCGALLFMVIHVIYKYKNR